MRTAIIFDGLVKSPQTVTPVKTGVQNVLKQLDSGFRRNDEKRTKRTFYEFIIFHQNESPLPAKNCGIRLRKRKFFSIIFWNRIPFERKPF
jgi:hypothetical protein